MSWLGIRNFFRKKQVNIVWVYSVGDEEGISDSFGQMKQNSVFDSKHCVSTLL